MISKTFAHLPQVGHNNMTIQFKKAPMFDITLIHVALHLTTPIAFLEKSFSTPCIVLY